MASENKTWEVAHDGRTARKQDDPSHTVNIGGVGEINTDVWMDRMEDEGFVVIDGRA